MIKKLIEVALPLPEINDASAYDKMPGIGPHPKGIHHWWARLPLPTARAVLFSSVVDDPSSHPELWSSEEAQKSERERLFDIVRRMMAKKLHQHPEVYTEARNEMAKYCGKQLPTVFDPFAGGGSIPLEASRLGFDTLAGDLNPVAVLLNKCNLEIAPAWAGRPPVNPESRRKIGAREGWRGTAGLAADIRYYARLVGSLAWRKLAETYPNIVLPQELGGGSAATVAWIWARTVASPIPAARGKHVPLISTYWLSSNGGSEVWLDPVVDKQALTYRFDIKSDPPVEKAKVAAGTKLGRGAKFACLLTNEPIPDEHVKAEGRAGRLGFCLLAIVADGKRRRVYLPAEDAHQQAANVVPPAGELEEQLAEDPRNIWCVGYGLTQFRHLYTPRQLSSMLTLSDFIKTIPSEVDRDARDAGLCGTEAHAYARAVTTFLGLALDRTSDFNNLLCRWSSGNQKVMNLFSRQAIPMVWDFAEANILGESVGAWSTCSAYVADCVEVITMGGKRLGHAQQIDAAAGGGALRELLVSTDPPYYDNISYAGLSDFFYVWLRRTLADIDRELFETMLVPKLPELTAAPERFDGNKQKAKEHFERGFRSTFTSLRDKIDLRFPLTVYYAFKQDDEESGTNGASGAQSGIDLTTGWETLLEALISSGLQITGTWPVRASQKWRMVSMGTNALASYIVLACRLRASDAPQTDRRSFVAELKRELPPALRRLQQGNIAPVDFAQAAIGPGMSIFSRYREVLESTGNAMKVRTALSLINQTLTEVLSEQEDDFDSNTRWAIAWFEQLGFSEGEFGQAELLSKAKVTSVTGLQHSGVIASRSGKVRLLRPEELAADWDPAKDSRMSVWEMTHHLLRVYFYEKKGDAATAELLRKLGSHGDVARELAYRLFGICEKRKRSQEAQAYNGLVLGWPEVSRMAREIRMPEAVQTQMFHQE